MIGVLVAAHGNLAAELLSSAALFCKSQKQTESLSFLPGDSVDQLYESLKTAVSKLDSGSGVIILTDLEGGSPSNQANRLIMEGSCVEVVTGVNMPMLLTVLMERGENVLGELAQTAFSSARKGIALPREKVMKRLERLAHIVDDMAETL